MGVEKEKNYLLCRASVIFENQVSMFNVLDDFEDSVVYRNRKFNELIDRLLSDSQRNVVHKNQNFIIYTYSLENIVMMNIGKQDYVKRTVPEHNGFENVQVDSYPYIKVFLDRISQGVLIEINSSIISEDSSLIFLENFLNLFCQTKTYNIFIRSEVRRETFWDYISKGDMVKELEFELLAPNLFGISDKASTLAKSLQKEFNAQRSVFKLVSQDGLVVSEDKFQSYVDYTSMGAGSWRMKLYKDGTFKRISSKKTKKRVTLTISQKDSLTIAEVRILSEEMKLSNYEKKD